MRLYLVIASANRLILAGALALITLSAAVPSQATVIAGPVVNPANGHSYLLLDAKSWTASEAEAVALGGHMATINDAAENIWVFDTFSPLASGQGNLWIGLNDAATEGTFVWSSGAAVGFIDWAS